MRSKPALVILATLSAGSAIAQTTALVISEAELATALRRLVEALPGPPAGASTTEEDARLLLDRAQRAWTAARDAQCALEAGLREGEGSASHAARCAADANRDRARRLEELADLALMSGP